MQGSEDHSNNDASAYALFGSGGGVGLGGIGYEGFDGGVYSAGRYVSYAPAF